MAEIHVAFFGVRYEVCTSSQFTMVDSCLGRTCRVPIVYICMYSFTVIQYMQ